MTSQPFSFQTSDDLSLYELLMLTADDLTTLDEFDAAMDRVLHEVDSQTWMDAAQRAQVSERFWAERARRIEAGRHQAALELEAWFAGMDEAEAAPLVAGEGQQVVTLPSFFWELVLIEAETDEEVERLGQRQTDGVPAVDQPGATGPEVGQPGERGPGAFHLQVSGGSAWRAWPWREYQAHGAA
jgi:hypothetical protein